jgi:hypothetical protein
VQESKLLAAHREAWRLANVLPNDPLRAILCTADPLERFRLAVASQGLSAKAENDRRTRNERTDDGYCFKKCSKEQRLIR